MTKKIHILLPILILISLLAILTRELFYAQPNVRPSTLINQTVPEFKLINLLDKQKIFTHKNLTGDVSLLNIWASWCYACQLEHEMLMKIKHQYHIPIYSINYKDNEDDAKDWLEKYGNPYVMTGSDTDGNVGIDLGVYGTPETFVINSKGEIVYRYIGAINQTSWDDVLYPLITKLKSK